MLLLKDDDVQKVLTMPMTLEALDETQKEIVKGNAATMGRIDVYLPCERPGELLPLGGDDRRGQARWIRRGADAFGYRQLAR